MAGKVSFPQGIFLPDVDFGDLGPEGKRTIQPRNGAQIEGLNVVRGASSILSPGTTPTLDPWFFFSVLSLTVTSGDLSVLVASFTAAADPARTVAAPNNVGQSISMYMYSTAPGICDFTFTGSDLDNAGNDTCRFQSVGDYARVIAVPDASGDAVWKIAKLIGATLV